MVFKMAVNSIKMLISEEKSHSKYKVFREEICKENTSSA